MTIAPAPKRNRRLVFIAGSLGCLVVVLLIAFVAIAWYFLFGSQPSPVALTVPPATPTVHATATPTKLLPTSTLVIPIATPVVKGPTPLPTLPNVATPQTVAPTVARPTATPVPPLPKGKLAFMVTRGDRQEDQYIWIMNADGSGAKQILSRATSPSFSPDGNKLVYYSVRDGIYVANLDGSGTKKILGDTFTWSVQWSHDGRLIALTSQPNGVGNKLIDVIPPDGSALRDSSFRHQIATGESPSWSRDDTQIAFHTCRDTTCGIYKGSSGGGNAFLVSPDGGGLPAWSPDGKKILYQIDVNDVKQLFVMNADGSGKKQLTSGAAMHVSAEWSLDGNYIFYRSPEGGPWGVWRMLADGSKPVKLLDDVPPHRDIWPYERIAVGK